ncbi:MAG: cell division protein FtsQ, partial [Paenibacillus sp.]|nr:cell division protein FtsQ [Paenibacillus sp.]
QEKMPVLREEKPRRRSNRKLLWFLFLLFVVLLAVLFFRSSISKIERIEITGQELLPEDTIRSSLGIQPGDHFFGIRSGALKDRVKQLPLVQDVEVSKKFPGLVKIKVKEYARVAFQFGADGRMEAVLANGLTVAAGVGQAVQLDKPILTGWKADDPWLRKLCEALASIPSTLLAEISEIKPSPTSTYEDKIKMYTRSPFEVYTTVSYLAQKMTYLEEMIAQMREKEVESGVFELLEVDTHTPFEQYYNLKPSPTPNSGKDTKKNG